MDCTSFPPPPPSSILTQMVVMTDSFRLLQLSLNILKDFVSVEDTKKYCLSSRIAHNLPYSIYSVIHATANFLAALESSRKNMSSSERDDSSFVDSESVPQGIVIPTNEFWKETRLPLRKGDTFKQHIGKGRKYLSITTGGMLD